MVLLEKHFAEIACCLAVKLGACILLGPLMPTRTFDHGVGKRRKKEVFSRWWQSLPMRIHHNSAVGLQVHGR